MASNVLSAGKKKTRNKRNKNILPQLAYSLVGNSKNSDKHKINKSIYNINKYIALCHVVNVSKKIKVKG